MTSRERQASGGATLVERSAAGSSRAPSPTAGDSRDTPPWEDLYATLPPPVREELFALAARQGLLYGHQLPPVDGAALRERRQLFTSLLAGRGRDLPPLTADSVAVRDEALDDTQREAVALALATPDIFLLRGLPGSGKSRVLAEIVGQAAARGERVLLLAATPAGLDRVLELLDRRDSLWPVRTLQPGESAETLSPCIRPLTFEERGRALRETALEAARRRAEAAAHAVEQQRASASHWDRLAEFPPVFEQIEACRAAFRSREAKLPSQAEFAWNNSEAAREHLARHTAVREEIAKERAGIDSRLSELRAERTTLHAEEQHVRPLAEARRGGRWWTLAYWKARFNGGLLVRADEVARRLADLDAQLGTLEAQAAKLDSDLADADAALAGRKADWLREESARLREELRIAEAELDREEETVIARWDEACRALSLQLSEHSASAVAGARRAWEERLRGEQERAEFARSWATALEAAAPALAGRLLSCANLVAATPSALGTDPNLAYAADARPGFDLLVVEEADLIPDADLHESARRCRRWVLAGEPEPVVPSRPGRVPVVRPTAFARLWQLLHCSPDQLPFRWEYADGRLCCRLRPVPDDQRRWIQAEPVVDSPEIELCILSAPRQEPALVEVRFPATYPPADAKDFILREVQEAACHACGPAFLSLATPAGLSIQTGDVPPAAWDGLHRAVHEEGVREVFRCGTDGPACETLGFEFDAAAGWTRARADEWLAERLNVCRNGRTTYLGRLYRSSGNLARFLARTLFRDAGLTAPVAGEDETLRVLPVPPVEREANRRAREGRRSGDSSFGRPGSRGAGFETDLSQPIPPERLPANLRAALPGRGLVNYPEAIELVETLEALVANPAFRADAGAWQASRLPAACDGMPSAPVLHAPAVAVSALYPAQVRLLRLLITRSPALSAAGLTRLSEGHFRLADCGLEVMVDTPPALRQRECFALLLSLTRSHTHRAVAFGEHASWLPLALTRADVRLLVFGDPGSLARRTEWHGAVDHLDDTAGEREREIIAELLSHLPDADVLLSGPSPAAGSVRR